MNINLSKIKKAYLIGIKGSGMVALAQILNSMNIEVTGSDSKEKFFSDEILDELGIKFFQEFDPKNIPTDAGLVVYSTSYNESNNSELKEAKENNFLTLSYPEMLGHLLNKKYGIAVTGTHGKTTTSAMLAHVMKFLGLDPGAVVGSKVTNWGRNALLGKGEYFIAEADEYQGKLSLYNPKAAILTSADWDHPDFFKNFEDYKKTFKDFVSRIPKGGFLVVLGDSRDTLEISESAGCKILTYGFSEECDLKIANIVYRQASKSQISDVKNPKPIQEFEILYKEKSLGKFEIQLTGKHNILNACAVIAVCHRLNLDMRKVYKALLEFEGTARRFEYKGEKKEAAIFDDYAHHPEEIRATLSGARQIFPDKFIRVVFHPHTFSRTLALMSEFSQSFADANEVIVLDIYSSAREEEGKVHSKDLVNLINKYNNGKAKYIATISEATQYLEERIGENDVVITMGAGDVWKIGEKLKENKND